MAKRTIRSFGWLASSALIGTVATAPTPASAQPTPDTLVSVCSGVSLPPSVVTGIMDPVVTGIYDPIETNTNQTLGVLNGLGLAGLPSPLSVDVSGLLTTAASGSNIGLDVVAQDGSLVAPGDTCNAQADGYTLDNPAGIAVGGNMISGLGATGQEAQAGEIDSIAIGNNAATDAAALQSIAIGTDATIGSGGSGSVALGAGSSANVANSVSLGAASVAARGPNAGYSAFGLAGAQDSSGEVSVGSPGAERQITNVAAGSAATDAVNVSQLQAVANLVPTDAVEYDDSSHTTVTLTGAGGTTITNVAPGALNAGSTDVVNGSQLFATNQQVTANTTAITNLQGDVTNLQTQVNNISSGAAGPVQYSDAGTPTVPNGGVPTNDVTLVGAVAGPVGLHNVADGVIAAGSTDAVNGGQLKGVQTTADDALALANNSVQYNDASHTAVTLGPGNPPVVVHNVAAGVAGTDAVNVSQLNSVVNSSVTNVVNTAVTEANAYTDSRLQELDFNLRQVRKDASAGTAAALAAAGLPQPMEPGKSMIAGGVGVYRGKAAFSIGASHVLDNGRSVFKVGVTYDASEHFGASGGFGVQF